jgi:hypothetical protein
MLSRLRTARVHPLGRPGSRYSSGRFREGEGLREGTEALMPHLPIVGTLHLAPGLDSVEGSMFYENFTYFAGLGATCFLMNISDQSLHDRIQFPLSMSSCLLFDLSFSVVLQTHTYIYSWTLQITVQHM